MEKAYDTKVLLERLKAQGLDLVEAQLGLVYVELKQWIKESAPLSENKIDDVLAPFVDQLDPVMLPLIDKIDGQVG